MASLWGPLTQPAGGDASTTPNIGRTMAQLSDGTLVFVTDDATGANLKLYYSTDRITTPTNIATWALPGNQMCSVALCVDAFDNIYVQYPNASGSGAVKAFVKTVGSYVWTPKTALVFDASNWSVTSTSSVLIWCNTGGGTAGGGHLLTIYRNQFGGIPQIASLDAGAALAGSGTIVVQAPANIAPATSATVMDGSSDGLGALQGLFAVHRAAGNGPDILSWQMTIAGIVTNTVITTGASGFDTTLSARGRLLNHAPGLWMFVAGNNGLTLMAAATFSMTALVQSAVPNSTLVSGGDWDNPAASLMWDVFLDPGTTNRAYVLSWGNATISTIRQLGFTCSPLVWDNADTLVDSAVGSPGVVANEYNIRCVNEPVGPPVDFQAHTLNASVYSMYGDVVQIEGSGNAPTIIAPANNAYVDVATGLLVTYLLNVADGPGQIAYALRFRIAGAAGYRYWNASTVSTSPVIVWNSYVTTPQGLPINVAIPAGILQNGKIYNISVATRSNIYIQSSFAADNNLFTNATPVTVLGGAAISATSFPYLTWNYTSSLLKGVVQTSYRYFIYSAAQYGIGGFTPGISPSTYDSGVIPSPSSFISPAVTSPIPNGTYRAYLLVAVTGGQTNVIGATGSKFDFTVAADLPAIPSLIAMPSTDPTTGAPRISLSTTTFDNILDSDDADFENFAWNVLSNCTAVVSGTFALHGLGSMRMTASSAATMSTKSASYAWGPLKQCTALASFRSAVTARTTQVALVFEDASHATLQTNTATGSPDAAGSWTKQFITATSPAGTAFVHMTAIVVSPANAEVHYVDCAGINPGSSTTWNMTGTNYKVSVQYSDDQLTWYPVRNGTSVAIVESTNPIALIYDYESPPTRNRYYKAVVTATYSPNTNVSPSSAIAVAATAPGTDWWLKDPIDTTTALAFNRDWNGDISSNIKEKATSHILLGRKNPVLVSDGMSGESGVASIITDGDVAYKKLLSLATRPGRVLLLQSPFGYQWYVNIDGSRAIGMPPWMLDRPIRTTQIPYVEADMP